MLDFSSFFAVFFTAVSAQWKWSGLIFRNGSLNDEDDAVVGWQSERDRIDKELNVVNKSLAEIKLTPYAVFFFKKVHKESLFNVECFRFWQAIPRESSTGPQPNPRGSQCAERRRNAPLLSGDTGRDRRESVVVYSDWTSW